MLGHPSYSEMGKHLRRSGRHQKLFLEGSREAEFGQGVWVNEGQTQIRGITCACMVVERPLFVCGGGLRDSDHARTEISVKAVGVWPQPFIGGISDPLKFFGGLPQPLLGVPHEITKILCCLAPYKPHTPFLPPIMTLLWILASPAVVNCRSAAWCPPSWAHRVVVT
jgi:hypothetical protein